MEVLKKYKNQIRFHLVVNIAFAVLITYASFSHYPLHDIKGYATYFLHFLVLQFTVFGFLYVIALNRVVFALVIPPIFLLLAVAGFFVYFQDIAISHSIIRATFESKPDIAFELISLPLVIYLIFTFVTIFLLVRWRLKILNPIKSPLTILAVIAILSFYILENYKYGILTRRLPYSVEVATSEYFTKNELALYPIAKTLKSNTDAIKVIFVLGETVRADHMQLNGYSRNTNPLLSEKSNLISFPKTYTNKTYTAESLQQLFTNASLNDNFDKPKYSLIDVLNHANVKTNWIGNQTPEISYEIFINQCQTKQILDPFHSELSFQKAYDIEMLLPFKKVFQSPYRQFTTLHMMGSHWWYETRYPDAFRKYTPVIKSKNISSNSQQEMVNSYDNTILYLDYFLDQTIRIAEKDQGENLLIYLSDHGELLGENNQWLHAQAAESVSNPAMVIWYSDAFAAKHPEWIVRLNAIKTQKLDLDFLFPSVLELFGVEGIPYDASKNIFR